MQNMKFTKDNLEISINPCVNLVTENKKLKFLNSTIYNVERIRRYWVTYRTTRCITFRLTYFLFKCKVIF